MEIKIPIKALSVNRAWQGRRFKSSFYKQFEKDVTMLLPQAKRTITGEIEVYYTFYVKSYALTDTDNLVKPIQDILTKRGYFKDDRQIVFYSAEKVRSNEEAIEIQILEYEKDLGKSKRRTTRRP